MKLTEFFSSSFTRVAAIVAAISASVALIAFAVAYFAFVTVSETQLRQLIDTDAAGLAELFAAEGVSDLAARIDDRLALQPVEGEAPAYAFADSNGRMLAGNIADWPDSVPLDATWTTLNLTLEDVGEDHILGRALLMPQDHRLFVGRTTASQQAALAELRQIFLLGFLATLGLGAVGGLAAAGLIRRKVASMNAALQAVTAGAIDQRAPGSEDRDEFGLLSRHINDALERIERLMVAQSEVNDLTAHELKSPLLRIDHTLGEAEQSEAVETARQQLAELAELIEALLDISAVSAQIGDQTGLEPVDLAQIVYSLSPLFSDMADEKGVTLSINAPEAVTMQGASVQLSRMVANLIDNAIKFSPEGGTVRVTVSPGPVLVVSDEGPGIPENSREHVFKRFVRKTQSGTVKGHGLGLSFVHAAARRHGLVASVETARPDHAEAPGARFIVQPH